MVQTPTDNDAGRDRLFHGVKFDVHRMMIPLPDGGQAERQVVTHGGSVAILPILDGDRIVMIRNQRPSVGKALLEIPAGTLEPGEDPTPCARRELIEETGYDAGRIERLCDFYTTPGFCTERMVGYVAYDLTHVGQQLEPTERIEVEIMTREAVLAAIRENAIEDGKSIATILYWATFAK